MIDRLAVLAALVSLATPLAILVFLTSFLVWMAQGRHDNGFTRFCNWAVVPSGALCVALVLIQLRYL